LFGVEAEVMHLLAGGEEHVRMCFEQRLQRAGASFLSAKPEEVSRR